MIKESQIKLLLTVLPVFTAGLYLVGAVYQDSYLLAFGVDSSMFVTAIDRVLLYGFTSLVAFGLKPAVNAILIALSLIFASIVAAVLSSVPTVDRLQAAVIRKLNWTLPERAFKPKPAMLALVDKGELIYSYITALLVIGGLLLSAVYFSATAGTEYAQRDMKAWSAGHTRSATVIVEGEAAFTALQLACSPIHCAYWTGTNTRVLRHDQTKSLVLQPMSIAGKFRQ